MTSVLTRTEFDREVADRVADDGPGGDYGGWYAVATRPFPCPAAGCSFVARHMTAAHLIVVWPEKDDPALLSFAADARNLGRDPKIVGWTPDLGAAISYYRWARIGRPVHGKLDRPGGVPEPRSFE
jgi:hypothetical protein